MTIERITFSAFQKILRGQTVTPEPCVIKLYSNDCHYCHGLREYYEEASTLFDDYHFFAFNVGDHPNLASEIDITGVPSILFVNSTPTRKSITLLEDPPFPNETSYYTFDQLKNFLNALSPEESQK